MDRRITKEKFISKVVKSPLTYIVLVVLIFLFSYSTASIYKKSRIAKEKTRQIQYDFEQLNKKEVQLRASLHDMTTDFGVEKALREKFGIIREGEVAIIIVDPPEPEVSEEDKYYKGGIMNFFKNIF